MQKCTAMAIANSSVSVDWTCPHGIARSRSRSVPRIARNPAPDLIVWEDEKTEPSVKVRIGSSSWERDEMKDMW
jgi:hypothetical protein